MSLRIVRTEADVTPEVILPKVTQTTNPMGWSQDGKSILVSITPQELAWVSLESKSVQTVKTFETWREVYDATVSPDGRFIAFSAKPVSGSNDKYIYIMDANGQRERAVVKSAGSRAWPFWRPDGTQLFFRGDRDTPGGSALWSIGIRDGEAVEEPRIVKDGFTDTPIGMTSSGSLFYARYAGGMPHQYLIHRNPAQGESPLAFIGQSCLVVSGWPIAGVHQAERDRGSGTDRPLRRTPAKSVRTGTLACPLSRRAGCTTGQA